MSNPQGPPGYPAYPPPGHGGGPQRSSSGATVLTAVLAVLFVVATAAVAWGVHQKDKSAAATPVGVSSGVPQPSLSSGVPVVPGASSSFSTSFPTPTISTYSPPPVPTSTRQPLNPEAINRTFQVYMNALLYRSLSQLKSATCPKLRHTETGTALDGKYINRWKGHRYTIYNSLDYVTISATVRYVNPNTGGNGGSHTYSWYVDRYPDGHYWVCGIL